MNLEVAKTRGLLPPSPTRIISGDIVDGRFTPSPSPWPSRKDRQFIVRRAKMKDDDQQLVELSISHDRGFAVAVCMALDEKSPDTPDIGHIVDDGSGPPLHEPIMGDEGWLVETKDESPAEDSIREIIAK
ncbi:MAG: hypothetical protein Q9222_002667, partial [Ikaeria aurantiellina]